MASVFARFTDPVTATVVKSFGSFREGVRVQVNRATRSPAMVGIADMQFFLPLSHLDESAREEIRQRVRRSQSQEI